jgi:hypothetical protein
MVPSVISWRNIKMKTALLIGALIAGQAASVYGNPTNDNCAIMKEWEPTYICATNGKFAVCAFDGHNKIVLQFNGIFVNREDLPFAGSGLGHVPVHIFDCGEKPQRPTDPRDPASWQPRREDFYYYGTVPYPVKDIDPPIDKLLTDTGGVLLGVAVLDRFYAFKDLGKSIRRPDGAILQSHAVLFVDVPMHRTNEVAEIVRRLRE